LTKEDIDPLLKAYPDMMAYFRKRASQQDIAFDEKVGSYQAKNVAVKSTASQFMHKIQQVFGFGRRSV